MDLIIKKGGILFNQESKEIEYTTAARLFESCSLDKDITLKDIFTLIEKEIDIYKIVLNNWIDEYIEESKKPTKEIEKDIEYLELHWGIEEYTYEKNTELCNADFPDFRGKGFIAKNDEYEDGRLYLKKGNRTHYAIEFSPVNELMHLPVKLNNKLYIQKSNYDTKTYNKSIEMERTFTLGQILHGIVFELSFTGSPKDRDDKKEDILKTVDEIKNNKETLER